MRKLLLAIFVLCLAGGSMVSAAVTTFTPPYSDMGDLDHYSYYVWNINLGSINPQDITGASIVLNDIYDWNGGNENDVLYINLLDWQNSLKSREVYVTNPTLIIGCDSVTGNQFGNTNRIAALGVPEDISIGYANRKDVTVDFTEDLLNVLKGFAVDGKIALGFDPDCHFYNNGITFNVTTATVPAPGAVVLGSIGIALVGWLRKRRTL